MISTELMVKAGKVYGNLMVDVRPTNEKLVERARRIVREVADVDEGTAARLLDECDRDVKTAICRAISGEPVERCRGELAANGGNVARTIRVLRSRG